MVKFLLISQTPALENNFDLKNTQCVPGVKSSSAQNLDKFPEDLNISYKPITQ
jgi:hypothetical protein